MLIKPKTMADNKPNYITYNDILKHQSKNFSTTQNGIILKILFDNPNEFITNRNITLKYSLRHNLKEKCIKFEEGEYNADKLFKKLTENHFKLPGDVQRAPRKVYEIYNYLGIERTGKRNNPSYKLSPITKEKYNSLYNIKQRRNIFTNKQNKNDFIKKHQSKCEICGRKKNGNVLIVIDHWYPHIIYNNSNKKNAVLLCEPCNNIHHNHDGSIFLDKYYENRDLTTKIIKKYIKIQERMVEFEKTLDITVEHKQKRNLIIDKIYNDSESFGTTREQLLKFKFT
jgi:hypothetical protein